MKISDLWSAWLKFLLCSSHENLQCKVYWRCEIFAGEILGTRILLELGHSLIQPNQGYHDVTYWLINFDASCHFRPSTFGVIVRVMLTLFTNKMVSLPVSSFVSFDSFSMFRHKLVSADLKYAFLLSHVLIYFISFLPIILPMKHFFI